MTEAKKIVADALYRPMKGDIPFLAKIQKVYKDGTVSIFIIELDRTLRCKMTKYADERGTCAPLESVKNRFPL